MLKGSHKFSKFPQLFPTMDSTQLASALLSNEGNVMSTIQHLLSQQAKQTEESNPSPPSHFMYPPSAVSLALSIESPFPGEISKRFYLSIFSADFLMFPGHPAQSSTAFSPPTLAEPSLTSTSPFGSRFSSYLAAHQRYLASVNSASAHSFFAYSPHNHLSGKLKHLSQYIPADYF